MSSSKLAHLWVKEFFEELNELGVGCVAVAPGSRSTVLAIQAHNIFKDKLLVHFDERGLAFAALGAAKISRLPSCIITTSGTAVANLLPAVIEARLSGTPLIIISADRPPELKDRSANQTIDQTKIFGDNVNYYFELPCASDEIKVETVRDWAASAWGHSQNIRAGVSHINWMFREPFLTTPNQDELISLSDPAITKEKRYIPKVSIGGDTSRLKSFLAEAKNGLCVVGELQTNFEADAVATIIKKIGWPTFADPLSQLRLRSDIPNLIEYGDLALLKEFDKNNSPDAVLHIGGRITSKRISTLLATNSERKILSISDPLVRFNPAGGVTEWLYQDLESLSKELLEIQTNDSKILDLLKRRNSKISQVLQKRFSNSELPLSEPETLRIISKEVPDSHLLFIGNSMPIRDLEIYSPTRNKSPLIIGNRGASGIDGLLATAFGASRAFKKGTTVVLGDLSLLHDINSLSLARRSETPFIIIVINNNGGGIFSLLPSAGISNFDKLFGTPHDLNFEGFSHSYGITHCYAHTAEELQSKYRELISKHNCAIIEVTTKREDNARLHREINSEITSILE